VTEGTITGYIYLNVYEYHSILRVTNRSIIIQQCKTCGLFQCRQSVVYVHTPHLAYTETTTHQSQSFSTLLISARRLKIYTILQITSLTMQPYLPLIHKYYRIYLKFSITHTPQQNYSPAFLHRYYKTLPNIYVIPPQYTIRTYMGTLLKIYTMPTSICRHT